MNITCALSPSQIEKLYANVYGHLSKNKSFDPETYMRNLFNKIAEKTNTDNAAKFLQYVPDIMFKAAAQVGLDNLPDAININRIKDLNKLFKDSERGLLNIIDVFKKDDTPILRQLAEVEKELALQQEQIEGDEPPVKNPDRFVASKTFTGTGSPFVKINPNDKKTLEPTTLNKSKKSFINTFDKLEKAFQVSENPDLFEYQEVQVKIKAQILSEFVRTNNINLLYADTQNEYNRSVEIVTDSKQKEDVFQNNQRVILVLVDEAGENLYFDQDGNITTKENGQIFYQFLRAARKTNNGFTVKDIYNIEDQVKDSKNKQKEFETLYNIQESLKSDPNAVQFLPFIGVTSGVNSDLSSIVIGIKDLIEQPTVDKNVVNTLDIAGEFDEQIRKGFGYIVLNNNKFEITRPEITETIANEIAELLMNPNIPVDTKIKVLEGYSSRTLTSKVKKHKYTNDGIFIIYAKTGLDGIRQDIKFTSEAISKMSDDEILNNITAIKNAYLKGYNGKPTFFTYEKDFINKTKPFLRYDINTKQIKVDNNYVDFITQFNQDVRLINADPGFYNKQIVFGAADGPISLLQDSQTETIDENLNSIPGTVNEIKEIHAALVERLKKGENITGDIIFPEYSKRRFSFVEGNGKIADGYNTVKNKDIVIINEENFGLEIDALRNSNDYLGVTAELKYRDTVDEFDDVIEVYIDDKYIGNIRISTDEEFEEQKKKDLSVENPSFQSQEINNNDLNTPQTSLDLDFNRSNYPDDKPTKELIDSAEKWWKTSKTGKIFRENNIGFSFAMNLVNSNVYAKFVTSGSNLLNPDDPFIASILINPAKGTFVDVYHESWHVFSQLFLSKAEKFELYKEVKNYKDASGKQPYINMNFFEIEEMLAEDFRNYAKDQTVKKGSPKKNSLFRRILKFLKALFGIKNPSAHEVRMDIMNIPRVAELYNNLYIGKINNYEPTINNIYFFEMDRGVSNVNYPKYEALSTGDSQQLSRSIDNLIVEETKAIYDERKAAGLPNLKATALGTLLLEKNKAYLYTRIKQRLQDKLDEETTKLGTIKGVPLLSTFKTKENFKKNAVAIMNNTKGRDKYVLLKSQIDDYNLLDADLKNGDRVKGEKWHSIKIVGDFYTHKELKDVDILVVSKYEDADVQLKNYIEGGAKAYDEIIPINPTFIDQVLTPEQEVLSDNIRILQTAIRNWGNDSKGVIQYHMNNSDFEILKKSVEVDIEENIDSDDNVKDPNNPAETHRDSSNLADEKNLKTKLQDLLGSETKFILKSLTKVDFEGNPIKDKFGFNERADFRKVFTQVAKTIGGVQDRNEVFKLLSEEANKKDKDGNLIFPELNELIEYKLPDPKNIGNRFEAKVSLSFWQDFSRPRIKYWNLLGVPIIKEIDMGGNIEKTPVGYDFIFTQSSIEVSSILKGWTNSYLTSPTTKYIKKTEDNKRELKLSKIIQDFSNSKGELDSTKDFEFANAIGIYFDDVSAIKDELGAKRVEFGLPYFFRILKTFETIESDPSKYSPLQVEAVVKFKQNPLNVLNNEIAAGIVDKSSVNQKTQVKRMIELQAKYGYDSANLGVLLPNNNIAYENSDMNAMLEKTNALNSAKSFADLIKNHPHMRYLDPKINTFTKRLTLLNQLFDLNNPLAERNDKTLETIYIAGFKPEGEVGQATTELDPLGRFLLGFSNVLLGGVDELPRMSEKKSSFAIRLKGGLQGGVTPTGITKGDDLYLYADVPMFREITKAREYIFENHMLNYIAAEFDRLKKFRNPAERPNLLKISGFNRPVGISQNGNEVVEGDIFSAFDTILKNSTKKELYALADDQLEMDIVDYIRQNRDLYDKIFNDVTEYFNFQTQSHIDLYYNKIPFVPKSILEKMFNRELNDAEIIDLRNNTKVINRLMQAYLYNDWIHKFETSIILMGDFAQWNHFKEDWSKRIPGVQSGGYSILNDKDWQNYMKTVEMTEDKTYAGKLSKQLDRKDLNNYIFSEKIITGVIKDAKRKSIYLDDFKEAWREAYESYPALSKEDIDAYVEEDANAYIDMEESDGIALITFDAYRALSISGRKWSVSQEDLFQKIANGDKVTPAQVFEGFPIRKYHYFGSLENDFIATTAMHKFSVMPLIPNGNAKEGSELYKLHLKMLKDNVQYVTFESGSKGSYLTEDGEVNNLFATDKDKDLNEEAIITANPIYLNYLKEVTVINDKLKNVIPIATQTRFIIYDNLFNNGKLINEKNKPLVDNYNTNVKDLTELYKRELLDEIGFEEVDGSYVGNLKRFVEVIRDELGKRNVPNHIQKLVDTSRKGDHLRYDLSLIPEAEKIEKLILSIIQNRIVRQKTKGEPMVQAPSTFTNGLWDSAFTKDEAVTKNKELEKKFLGSNTLPFYRRGEIINKKTGERSQTYLAKVAIPFNGDFVNLLNLEWQGSKIQTMDRLNELIKTDEFLNQHREAITLVGPRIPNDATNTIEAFEVWHFVDASVLNTVIVPTELVAKAGSDFDGDKLFLTMPHIDKTGKVVNTGPASYEDFIKEYERLKTLETDGKLSKDDLKPKKYLEQVKKYYQNKYITSAANIMKIPENFAYLIKPNKTYLVQKYVADLEKGSNLYDRYDNPYKISSITNKKGQKRISPSTLLTVAYNLYKFDANLSLEPALGITAKVNKNHIMYKTLLAPMPLVYKKQINLGNGLVDETVDVPMHLRFKHNKLNIDGKEHISLSGAFSNKGPRITDVNSHNLNGILDRGKESWPFTLQLFPEAIGVINYLIQVGVSEEEVFYLMNQPLVKQYIENIRKYNNAFSPVLTPGIYARYEAKQDALKNIPYDELVKIGFRTNELKLKRHVEFMSGPIEVNYKNKEGVAVSDKFSNVADFKKSDLYKNELQKIISIYDLNPDSNVVFNRINLSKDKIYGSLITSENYVEFAEAASKYIGNTITIDKLKEVKDSNDMESLKALAIFANYIELENQKSGLDNFQIISSYDTDKLSTVQQVNKRRLNLLGLKSDSKINDIFVEQVMEKSIMKNFNNTDLIISIAESVLPFRLHPVTAVFIQNAMSNSKVVRRFGEGVSGEEKFTKNFNNAVLNNLFQNRLTYFYNVEGIKATVPEVFHTTPVKINNSIENEVNITDDFIEVNLDLLTEIYENRAYLAKNFTVDKNYTNLDYHTFIGGNLNPFKNLEQFVKFVMHREFIRKDKPLSSVKDNVMYKNILEESTSEKAAYEKFLAESALYASFNPAYISGTTTMSYYDLVMRTIIDNKILTNTFPVLNFITQATLKNSTLRLFDFSDGLSADGDMADSYKNQLDQLGDIDFSKYAGNEYKELNKHISNVFKYFSEVVYFQHGVGKNRFGFANILNAEKFTDLVKQPVLNFEKNVLSSEDPFSNLEEILKTLLSINEFKNYTVTVPVDDVQEESEDDTSEIVFPRVIKPTQEPASVDNTNKPILNSLPNKSSSPTMTYAGIGSRQTPQEVLDKMTEVAKYLDGLGYTLQTGFTFKNKETNLDEEGADKAFSDGSKNKTLFGPYSIRKTVKGIVSADKYNEAVTEKSSAIVKEVHPAPDRLTPGAIKLMARNTNQIFGKNLDNTVDFVIFYAPETNNPLRPKGGTGQAVEMARRKGIPTINMADTDWREQLKTALATTTQSSTQSVGNVQVESNYYTTALLKANPDKIYVFGDNVTQTGKGGQAIVRDEENAFGIPTKSSPNTYEKAYFNDKMYEANISLINRAIEKIKADGRIIVLPKDGLGTGLAKTKEKAPDTYQYLKQRLLEEFGFDNDTGNLSTETTQSSTSVKEGVSELFESNSELNNIGTPEQYSAYLDSIFPDSKVKDIVYHVNKTGNITPIDNKAFYSTDFGSWLIELEEMKGKRNPIILNIINPTIVDEQYEFSDKAKKFRESGLGDKFVTPDEVKKENTDSVIGRDSGQGGNEKTYITYKPEQVHALGSKQDIAGFKKFVSDELSTSVKPTNTNLNLFGLEGFNIPDTGDTC